MIVKIRDLAPDHAIWNNLLYLNPWQYNIISAEISHFEGNSAEILINPLRYQGLVAKTKKLVEKKSNVGYIKIYIIISKLKECLC